VFGRNASKGTALVDIRSLVALFGVRLVASFLFCWPLSMATRRFRGLLIGFVFLITTIIFSPLLLLFIYLFFTPFDIGGRRITSSWPRTALRSFLSQGFLHGPQGGGVMPSLGPPLGGGLLDFATNLHPHFLDRKRIWK
jgi:hypothetical protein